MRFRNLISNTVAIYDAPVIELQRMMQEPYSCQSVNTSETLQEVRMDPKQTQASTLFLKSFRAFIGIVILLTFFVPRFLFAQATGGSVQGHILDENGQPLPGATITATQTVTNVTRTVTSDNSGYYRISELKVGPYSFTVNLSGFATQVRSGVNILVGQQAQLDFTMKVATVEESIVVDEDVPVIEPTKTSIGATITKQQIDDLPLQNRDFVNLAFLAPGITFARTEATDISGSGSTGSSNTFLIDGLSNDQDAIGDSRGDFSPDG